MPSIALVIALGTSESILSIRVLSCFFSTNINICPRGSAMLFDCIVAHWIGFNEANPLVNRKCTTTSELFGLAQPLKVLTKSETPGAFKRWTVSN